MTVEELIEKLQQIKNKKSCIKMDTPSSGFLLYRAIHDIRIAEANGYVVINWERD